MSLRRLAAALVLSSAFLPAIAHAQVSDGDKAVARQLAVDGLSALARRDYAAAADHFRRADSLIHAPTVALGLARSYVGLGKLVAAQEQYNRLIHMPLAADASPAFVQAVADGKTELAALEPRIPDLVINVRGPAGLQVTLDGNPVPPAVLGLKRPVDPGRHVVRAAAPGIAPKEATVSIGEGRSESVSLDLGSGAINAVGPAPAPGPASGPAPLPPPGSAANSSPLRPVGFAVLGVGAASLVTGAVTAGLAASKRSSILSQCPAGYCLTSQQAALQPDVDSLHTLATVSTATFVVGGVLAAGGLVLVLVAPKARPATTGMTPILGPGFVGMKGRF